MDGPVGAAQLAALEAAAERAGLPLSRWLREVALRAAGADALICEPTPPTECASSARAAKCAKGFV